MSVYFVKLIQEMKEISAKISLLFLALATICPAMFFFGSCMKDPGSGTRIQVSNWNLLWEDNFDHFDSNRWEKATHTFKNNDSQFTCENVTFQNGTMKLHLTSVPTDERQYSGAEYRTKKSYLYGKFVVRMKFPPGSGIVSSFFTYRDPPRPRWNEIDIEVLGRDTSKVQFTHWWGRAPNFKAQTFEVGFNVDEQFHEYTFEWLPDSITWYIDGIEKYTVTENIPNLPQQIMMNIWICTTSEWAGEFDSSTLPAYAEYDYVKFYQKDEP